MPPEPGLKEKAALLAQLEHASLENAKFDRLRNTALRLNLEGGGDIAKAIQPRSPRDCAEFEKEVGRYGGGRVAEALVIAGRLVRTGVGFVTVSLSAYEGFDMHVKLKERMGEMAVLADRPIGTILQDIHDGRLPAVAALIGEFGRTPRMNATGGRDHWHKAGCVLMAGGHLARGKVFGETDRMLEVKSGVVKVEELPLLLRYAVEGTAGVPTEKVSRVRGVVG